ncbi:MaoC family dehydratase [Pseudidiomarina sediminum]|uniref:MaoC family dehydratase n=1 Tax=Pseudidiomarina sediminum TaxID=431675 RepID=A0A432ZB67_9GAMM|nr:MaoC family dehydratase [Pseudidiomarina sediminum]MBY6064152.1 MaoC family dehydratase [Pseudidiomarina sediminum]RUO75150.1 MaoC family dehydratase [Pseudidiomarina sediminum]
MKINFSDVGKDFGVSDWVSFSQQDIDTFGKITRDIDPYHMNVEWAAEHSPFKSTIAYGFLTLSMLTYFCHQILDWPQLSGTEPEGMGLNYGFDKVRFLAPVPVNTKIRGRMKLIDLEERHPGEWLRTFDCTIEIEGSDKPALIAVWKGLFVEPGAGRRLKQED